MNSMLIHMLLHGRDILYIIKKSEVFIEQNANL